MPSWPQPAGRTASLPQDSTGERTWAALLGRQGRPQGGRHRPGLPRDRGGKPREQVVRAQETARHRQQRRQSHGHQGWRGSQRPVLQTTETAVDCGDPEARAMGPRQERDTGGPRKPEATRPAEARGDAAHISPRRPGGWRGGRVGPQDTRRALEASSQEGPSGALPEEGSGHQDADLRGLHPRLRSLGAGEAGKPRPLGAAGVTIC